jgi:LmbE family N-acetylglucosaminyl deacetylase
VTWDFPDGSLQPSLELRTAIIREIREFGPDLVLTHRPFDYHPDHRAVGQAVQDASYMVMVPKIAPGSPVPDHEPIVAYMVDLFTRPCSFRADAVIDVSKNLSSVLGMMHCHASQFYEWMPWIDRTDETMPDLDGLTEAQQNAALLRWLEVWYGERTVARTDRFWREEFGPRPKLVEAYEVSEYAGKPSAARMDELFPGRAMS